MDHADRHRRQRYGYMPWTEIPEVVAAEQPAWQSFLRHEYDVALGDDVFIAPEAMVWLPDGRIGDRTWLASHAVVRGDVAIGQDCSINPYATVAGDVTIGDHVRIAPLASVWGFNHGFDDPDAPIHEQESTYEGVEIGDDVWIGANAAILDGVTVGDHSVVGAGAVVTDDVAPYRVVGGNPARVIRDRRADGRSGAIDGSAEPVGDDLPAALRSFGERAAEQLDGVLERYRDGDTYLDRPGADRTVRAPCDAVEVAGMFDAVPPGRSGDAWVSWLRGLQDPETGLFPDPGGSPDPDADPRELPRTWDRYHILAVGYALEVLGAAPDHRISAVDALTPDALYDRLDGLPWDDHAWRCGDWIDCYGTGLYFNHRYFDGRRSPASVFGWLETNVDPDAGLWGEPTTDQGWLQPVNGFYRLTRGTYAQFGIDVPAPERAIDTVLRHARESPAFQDARLNACNVLDVIHPLWLCGKQTDYRRDEARQWARDRLPVVLDAWQEDQGFGFRLAGDDPSLQGTEMWLSIVYLLADVCGWADALGYRPRGVHRTDVPLELRRT